MKKKIIIITITLICLIGAITSIIVITKKGKSNSDKPQEIIEPIPHENEEFLLNLIKTVNSTQQDNYLISPYSIEIALNMVKEGADEETKEELIKVLKERNIKDVSIKNRIGVANGMFLRDKYKDVIEENFNNTLINNYKAEVVVDPFTRPDKINDWVKEKTKGMIPKILDEMSPNFVLGLANAIAIDVNWYHLFECNNTQEAEFKKTDGTKLSVEMMHNSYEENASYFETEKAKGVILPYKKYDSKGEENYEEGSQLEFIGILPKEKVSSYIENLTIEELQKIEDNKKEMNKDYHLQLSIPRFSYDFDLGQFKKVLNSIGLKKMFDSEEANFNKIITEENRKKKGMGNLYIDTAIHKTHIDFNEKGTKAAAVTYFGFKDSAAIMEEFDTVQVEFNKPFVYLIRDVDSKEILFFGVVETPNEWKGTTCKEK